MRLSDIDIISKVKSGEIKIDPIPEENCFGSFSVDVRLGNVFQVFCKNKKSYIDLSSINGDNSNSENIVEKIIVGKKERFFINPRDFVLGITMERVTLANHIVGWLDGRSSLARVGLMVHMTAHSVDPGWDGHITFEFYNAGSLPLALKPGMRIGALSFELLSSPTGNPYYKKIGAKYNGQKAQLSEEEMRVIWK